MELPLKVREPIASQLVAALRQGIVELKLMPGEALSEKEIAARFGVSRQPVREAFIKLSEAGLVEIRPSRGTYVMKISVRELANARYVREAIECDIARDAGRLAQARHVEILRGLLDRQRTAAARNDYHNFNDHDEAFHRAIADIIDCDYAWRIVESARVQTDRVRFLSLPAASPMPLLIRQHEAIVDRLAANDPQGAENEMRRHLREILLALPQLAAAYPDLFADTELPTHTIGLIPQK
ncbi:MAG: GntR family transcriptional regulator [Rhizobiaceae bacterium]|nr:GntR family transcriptional regulator [Rhizobiaceae bacterium]MCV0405931.1 GntR family transcriptional regulator [Rhizobiaceae bacterium]